jgi:hypothetical protein
MGKHHGYDPNQPRHHKGTPVGGEWSGGSSSRATRQRHNLRQVEAALHGQHEDTSYKNVSPPPITRMPAPVTKAPVMNQLTTASGKEDWWDSLTSVNRGKPGSNVSKKDKKREKKFWGSLKQGDNWGAG